MQFRDLYKQYEALKKEIDKGIQGVIDSTAFILGKPVTELEKELAEYVGRKYCVACGNGTDALVLALKAYNVGQGDAVFTADFTYIASASCAELVGATSVFADINLKTFNIDPVSLEKQIQRVVKEGKLKPKAIVPVDLFGQPANYDELEKIAKKYGLIMVEDAAQGFGGMIGDKRACSFGDISCTSFFPAKPLGCYGDGGALFTNDDDLAEKIRCIANHGMKVRYHHDRVGVNSRLDSIQAAVLDVKLRRLMEYTEKRQAAAAYYTRSLQSVKELILPQTGEKSTHVFHQYTLQVTDGRRDQLQAYLKEHEIPSMIYYPIPLHLQKAYQSDRYGEGDFPVAERLSKTVLSLPMHTELDEEQLNYIVEEIKRFFD